MTLDCFLAEDAYIDYSAENIQRRMTELYRGVAGGEEKARRAYGFVRDQIPHSFDCNADVITARASDVLEHGTGICHAKANLLAALLRPQGIPVGLCFQHITLMDDDSMGYCVHCYNAVYLNGRWIKVDARGNTGGICARFSLAEPVLAFQNRAEYNEYHWPGIYPAPHPATMNMLERSRSIQDVLAHIPDNIDDLSGAAFWAEEREETGK